MRVAVFCNPLVKRIWSDSKFLPVWDTIEQLLVREDVHVYLVLDEGFRAAFEERYPEGVPRVTCVYEPSRKKWPQPARYFMSDSRFLADSFSRRYGNYQVDWAICAEPEGVPYVKVLLSDDAHIDNEIVRAVPVLVLDFQSTHLRFADYTSIPLLDLPSSLAPAWGMMQGYPVFPHEGRRRLASEEWEQMLSPAAIRAMRQRTLVLPYVMRDDVHRVSDTRSRESIRLMFAGRISSNKNLKLLNTILSTAASDTPNLETIIAAPAVQMRSRMSREFAERFKSAMHIGLPREEFWSLAASCHIGLCTSEHESFGMSFMEQIALGQAVLLPRFEWVDDIYPSWYPFRYSGAAEALVLIERLAKAYWTDEVQSQIRRVQEWVRAFTAPETYRSELFGFVERIQQATGEKGRNWYPPALEYRVALSKAMHACQGKRVPLPALFRVMKKYSKFWAVNPHVRAADRRKPGNYDIFQQALAWGAEDVISAAVPTLRIPSTWTLPSGVLDAKE